MELGGLGHICLLIEVMIAIIDVLGAVGIRKAPVIGDWLNDTWGLLRDDPPNFESTHCCHCDYYPPAPLR